MVKKSTNFRKCTICNTVRRTTNTEEPFICENPCLRIDARNLLLKELTGKKSSGYAWIVFGVLLFVAYLIGKFV